MTTSIIDLAGLDGGRVDLTPEQLDDLDSRVAGPLLCAGDESPLRLPATRDREGHVNHNIPPAWRPVCQRWTGRRLAILTNPINIGVGTK